MKRMLLGLKRFFYSNRKWSRSSSGPDSEPSNLRYAPWTLAVFLTEHSISLQTCHPPVGSTGHCAMS